ncbi:MAG: DUF4908 domain-containing protein [Hydrogenophilaceae bacterium]|jgi:hypothetical protein|nr:DUF4908 domain-containing protein [Hydrogenophilaceae bacterium]
MSQSGAATRPPISRPLSFTGAVAAALALTGLGAGAPAAAQQIPPGFNGQPNDMRIGPSTRYATPDSRVRFTFDRSGRTALLQFEGESEVHVLRSVGASGGGELYRDEADQIRLRITPNGGVTIYTRLHRNGEAAGAEGAAPRLAPAALEVAQYQRRMAQLSAIAAQRLGRPITITAPREARGAEAGLIIDAAERAIAGLERAPPGVARITIQRAAEAQALRRGDELAIGVNPAHGYAGRPSTHTISNALADGLLSENRRLD